MTRTDVVASSRPQTADAAPIRKGSIFGSRRLVALPLALLLGLALTVPTAALAAGSTSKENGYSQSVPTPKPATGTSPSKEKSTPAKSVAPATTSTAPTTESAKAQTLPFTGLDLRWTVGIGVLLMAAGFSIVTVQRRHHRNTGG
jgi:hypothetical protein